MTFRLIRCGLAALLAFAPAASRAQSADGVALPKLNLDSYAPAEQGMPDLRSETGRLALSASLTKDSEPIQTGLVWRVFSSEPNADGALKLIAKAEGGSATLDVPEGRYLVHAAFGRAGATKKILVGTERIEERLVLDAGGLMLNAEGADGKTILPFKLKFSIYDAKTEEDGEKRLIAESIAPGSIVRLNEGNYHIVSNFGNVNAIMRTDVRVEAGVITEATVQHRAAEMILKLVSQAGGEALADTSWSVYTESGELLFESVGAYAPVVLAEGAYSVIAKHRDRVFEKAIEVQSGKDGEVEVLATF